MDMNARGREYTLFGEFTPGENTQSTLFPALQLTPETLFFQP